MLFSCHFLRADIACVTQVNPHGQMLHCSIFRPPVPTRRTTVDGRHPAVVYLHGNCGSRLDAEAVVDLMVPEGFCVIAYDCSVSMTALSALEHTHIVTPSKLTR